MSIRVNEYRTDPTGVRAKRVRGRTHEAPRCSREPGIHTAALVRFKVFPAISAGWFIHLTTLQAAVQITHPVQKTFPLRDSNSYVCINLRAAPPYVSRRHT